LIRLLLRLFRITDYDICLSCSTLKEQLVYERAEKAKLTETLLNIINPKAIEQPIVELQPLSTSSASFTKRRAALEEKDRQEAKILRESKVLARPDFTQKTDSSILNLEQELGVGNSNA